MQVPTTRYPATTVSDAYAACDPYEALEPGDQRWVDLSAYRGGKSLARTIAERIRNARAPRYHIQLIAGHRGCGKSTELKQLQAHLSDLGYFAVYLDVEELIDVVNVEYLDVLLCIARGVHEALADANIHLSKGLLESLDAWFAERLLTEEQRHDVEATLQAKFAAKGGVPLLLRFLAAATGVIKSGGSRRVEVRRVVERELAVFVDHLNTLLDDARLRLTEGGLLGLVVLVDGLDKMPYKRTENGQTHQSLLFVEHAEQLRAPHAHVLYTVPVVLVFDKNLGDVFAETDLVPMVNITTRDAGSTRPGGLEALVGALGRRVRIGQVIENEAVAEELVRASGGFLRDLMRLVRLACEEGGEKITVEHARSAFRRLVLKYEYLVEEEAIERLVQVAQGQRIPWDELSGRLLDRRLVFEYYNDNRWADLHPAVRAIPWVNDRLRRLA